MRDRVELDDIRSRLSDPHLVAASLGLLDGARREGRGVKILCPRHGERRASCSLTVGPDGTLRVRCFACDLKGDIFTLVAQVHNLDLHYDFLAVKDAAASIAGVSPSTPRAYQRPTPPHAPPSLDDATFAALVAALPRTMDTDVARYLADRHILEEAQKDGWTSLPTPPAQPALTARVLAAFSADILLRSGLFTDDPLRFTHSPNRLCIPWRSPDGTVQTLQRRCLSTPGTFPDGSPRPKYVFPRGRNPRHLYGVERLSVSPSPRTPLVLTEGAIDVLAFRVLGAARNYPCDVLGIPGAAAWRASLAGPTRGRHTFIATDGDEAGDESARRVAGDVMGSLDRLRPAQGAKDWADVLRKEHA